MGYKNRDAPFRRRLSNSSTSSIRHGHSSDAHEASRSFIPCQDIHLGSFLFLGRRACQVLRISQSSTGQYRYLGMDPFTGQLYEDASFAHNPISGDVFQAMCGPALREYNVLNVQDNNITAMTETGELKANLPVIGGSKLYSQLESAFESDGGIIDVMVLIDRGRELAVDLKVTPGSCELVEDGEVISGNYRDYRIGY